MISNEAQRNRGAFEIADQTALGALADVDCRPVRGAGDSSESAFDLFQFDPEASNLYLPVESPEERQPAVFSLPDAVPRLIGSPARWARYKSFGRELVATDIASGQARPT